ncbi:alpha/beta hydrolase family protein [Inhella proteolytica]|uniref:S9 family peptidase n=1 Tax=Inhella proteolytica TaxID=2795029 RepID=A0A931NHG9_9BURK|nr:prolyl oligopeptidase family serine peptidase [Inhella proteolytica]MBH9578221.1 S9 family peptidase [Inhella proteolytica]
MNGFRLLALWCAFMGLSGQLVAQEQTQAQAAVPAERFFERPAMQDAALSPSGRYLAFLAGRRQERQGLYVLDLRAGGSAQALAQFKEVDVQRFQWVNDERLVFSVWDMDAGSYWAQREAPGLFSVGLEGAKPRELIQRRSWRPVESRSMNRQSALDFRHELLKVPEGGGDEVVIGRWDAKGLQPLWLNVRTGSTRHYEVDAPGPAAQWLFDSRGQARALVTQDGLHQRVFARAPGESEWRQLSEGAVGEVPLTPRFVDDQGQLYVHHPEGLGLEAVLSRYDFERKQVQSPPLLRVEGFDVAANPVLEGGRLVGLRFVADAERSLWLDARRQAWQDKADQRFPGQINRIDCRRCEAQDAVVLVRTASDRDAGQFWLYHPAEDRWQGLARRQPGIEPGQMARVSLHRVPARDGFSVPVWLTHPAGTGPHPAVVLVHGGPWVRGRQWEWEPLSQFLASRGWLVIEPEFRGSTGFGDAHFRAGFRQWGLAMQNDVADALRWAQGQKLAGAQACIAGGSYGGYSALMGLIRHPELYRCGVAWAALSDLDLLLKGSFWVSADTSPLVREQLLTRRVGDPEKHAAQLQATSPVLQAGRLKQPLLLAYGEQDRRVPLAHGERLREALRAAGQEPEWVVYKDEAHGWGRKDTQLDFANRLEAFFSRHLAP